MGSCAILSEQVFSSFQSGDEKSFKMVYKTYFPIIKSHVFRFTHSVEDAEEIVHEAFVALFLHRYKIANANGLYPYLFTIAKRLTISSFRKKVSEKKYEEHLKMVWQETSNPILELIFAKELQQSIDKAVAELPAKQKEVYLLNKEDELSYVEISDLLGISKNTVKNHLVIAMKHIRLRLAELNIIFFIILFFFNSH